MKRILLYFIFPLIILCMNCVACSKGEEGERKKGRIEEMAEETGHSIARSLKAPVNKARDVKDMEEERADEIDEYLEEK
jgi:aspartate oxidase